MPFNVTENVDCVSHTHCVPCEGVDNAKLVGSKVTESVNQASHTHFIPCERVDSVNVNISSSNVTEGVVCESASNVSKLCSDVTDCASHTHCVPNTVRSTEPCAIPTTIVREPQTCMLDTAENTVLTASPVISKGDREEPDDPQLGRYWELEQDHGQIAYVQGRLKKSAKFWEERLMASQSVKKWVSEGYKLPFLTLPPPYYKVNQRSAS